MNTHYQTLKVSRDAPAEVIRMAYKVLCQKYHPDKYPGNRESAERITKELTAAYAVLSNPDKKKAYDEFLDGMEAKGGQEQARESARKDHKPKEEPKQDSRHNADESEAKPRYKPYDSQWQPPQDPPKPRQQPESHHPWRRMAARYIDMNIFAFTGAIGFAFLSSGTENPVVNQLLYAVVAMAGCILLEPVVLAMFGGTPGKAILNISMESKTYPSIQTVPFSELLKRTFQVYFFGLGLGLFLIVAPFFFMFKDYKLMKQTGFTRWDKACGTQVCFGEMGFIRFLAGSTLVLLFLTLNFVGKTLNRNERKEWYAAKYHSGERTQVSSAVPNPRDNDNSNNNPDELDLFKKYGVKPPTTGGYPKPDEDAEPKTAEEFLEKYHPKTLNDAQTQFKRGLAYENGDGVPQNYAEATKWYRMAANQGYARAQFNLGLRYANGQGVPQNYAEAAKWMRLATEQGLAQAQYALGLFYHNGQGVNQNYVEAAKWYRMATNQGYAMAQYNLGVLYHNGQGVLQNHAEAAKWYRLAANQGMKEAQAALNRLYGNPQ